MKRKPLYVLAEEKKLGNLQVMDAETITWLEKLLQPTSVNIREVVKSYVPLKQKEFEKYIPSKGWFLRSGQIRSIHGINHIMRVMLYSYVINQVYQLAISTADLLTAAASHDLRRRNDKGDPGHGNRASKWYKKNKLLFGGFASNSAVEYAVANHETPDTLISLSHIHYKDKLLLILKTADALDRYRLPRTKWWPNQKHLKLKVGPLLLNFAKSFTFYTERDALGQNTREAIRLILNKADECGILDNS